MPTYDYECTSCGHKFEQFQSITAKPLRKCPGCGKLKVRRLIGTGAGVIFKGSGFYCTDYRSDSYRNAAKSDSAPAASGNSKEPAAKPESKPAESKPARPAKPAASTGKSEK